MPCGGSTPRSTTPMTSCWWTLPQSGCHAQTSSRPSRPSLPPPTALLSPMPGGTHTHTTSVCLSVCQSFRIQALPVCLLCRIQALSVCLSVCHSCRIQTLFVCLSICAFALPAWQVRSIEIQPADPALICVSAKLLCLLLWSSAAVATCVCSSTYGSVLRCWSVLVTERNTMGASMRKLAGNGSVLAL